MEVDICVHISRFVGTDCLHSTLQSMRTMPLYILCMDEHIQKIYRDSHRLCCVSQLWLCHSMCSRWAITCSAHSPAFQQQYITGLQVVISATVAD